MVQVFIGFGSNLGDKTANIKLAINLINNELGIVVRQSSLYESEPWGFESSEMFVNGVLEIYTKFSAELLLVGLKKIECDLGRKEKTSTLSGGG
jgi:2-amino-4-hydroxy-6-hydroxymethyldihydropteridine diphosphokinase